MTIIDYLITGGVLVGAFFDEIMNWAKDKFNSLSNGVKKAWVYIRRIPGGIKQMMRYIENGKWWEKSEDVQMDIEIRYQNKEIDKDTYERLQNDDEMYIGTMERKPEWGKPITTQLKFRK